MMIGLDKIKAFFKRPKPEAKAAEKKAVEPSETKIAEAPEKKVDESSSKKKNGPCRGKPGCWGFSSDYHQLNLSTHSSRTGALGVIGLSSLLTMSMPSTVRTIDALKAAGLRSKVKIMVGGAPTTQQRADEAPNAVEVAAALIRKS